MSEDSKPQTYAEMKAALAARADKGKAARKARDEKEFAEQVFPLLIADETLVHVEIPDSPAHLPGHYVGRRGTEAQVQRYKHILFRDISQRGAVEAKARAGDEFAEQCLVHPSADKYELLVAGNPLAATAIAARLLAAAQGGAEAEGKG